MITCKLCKVEESPTWWKCCPTHTTEQGPDVVCQVCANQCMTPKEDDIKLIDALNVQLKDMDIPFMRRDLSKIENVRWLWRNLRIYNDRHPNCHHALLIVYEILNRKKY